jgi:hypothetical protein
MIERHASESLDFEVVHEPHQDFILNSAAFYSGELHRHWANLKFNTVSPQDWKTAVATGISNWQDSIKKKDEAKEKKQEKEKEKVLARQMGHVPHKKRKTRPSGFDQSQLQSQVEADSPVAGPSNF